VVVDELEPAVGQLVGQQAAGEADLAVQRLQRGALQFGIQAEVELVDEQVAGADATVALDAVADGVGQEGAPGAKRKAEKRKRRGSLCSTPEQRKRKQRNKSGDARRTPKLKRRESPHSKRKAGQKILVHSASLSSRSQRRSVERTGRSAAGGERRAKSAHLDKREKARRARDVDLLK
jgi:hypothetical protein